MADRELKCIIPSRKRSNLVPCVEAIRKLDPSVKIIVIDDGLWDVTGLEDCEIYPGLKPFVFARNINLGIQITGDSDVVLLNDDAVLESECGFTKMQEASYDNPEYGIVSSAVRGPSNSREHSPRGQWLRPFVGYTIPFVSVFIPRSTIQKVGLLEERFDCYGGDDDDYCYRVRKAKLKLGIFDGCVVDHSKLVSTFRPDGKGLPIHEASKIFKQIHGFEMATR